MTHFFEHCEISTYQRRSGWGWKVSEGEKSIGTTEGEENLKDQIAALNAAKLQAHIVESRWRAFESDWIKLNKFFADYSRNTKCQIWVEDLPGGQAWLVYHKRDSKDKPDCGRLIFDGIGGWKAEAKWLEILVKAAFNITENQEKKPRKRNETVVRQKKKPTSNKPKNSRAMLKPQSFQIENLKSSEGPETIAFHCCLTYEERKIASICNEGRGEGHKYTWENKIVEEEFQAGVTDELVWDLLESQLPLSETEVEARVTVGR